MAGDVLMTQRKAETAVGVGALLLSSGTLICCALPLLLVSVGLGASVAALTSAAPWLVTLSVHKAWVFTISGIAIAGAAFALYRPGRACPTDPKLAVLCERTDRWNRIALTIAVSIWLFGLGAAYLWLPVGRWLDV